MGWGVSSSWIHFKVHALVMERFEHSRQWGYVKNKIDQCIILTELMRLRVWSDKITVKLKQHASAVHICVLHCCHLTSGIWASIP